MDVRTRKIRLGRRLSCAAFAALAMAGVALGQSPPAAEAPRPVMLIEINGPIGPASARFLQTSIERAQTRGAEALILQMNTPGGLASSMRDMITAILASGVPVVGFVAPPGAHAASAGTYILYATHVAAMAPGTNIGAATPVQIGGGGLPGLPGQDPKKDEEKKEGEDKKPATPMDAKAVSDAVALIRGLAELRGRNADWAERAVREAESLSATPALQMQVIDVIARDVPALLDAVDGRGVTVGATERTLRTRGAPVERIEPGVITNILGILSNPNVALILMLVGVYGLIFELANPGTVGPGVIGVICLVLALYALNQLPLNYAGLALLILGILFMVVEAITPSFGLFGFAGIVAFILGAAMLIDTDIPAFQLNWSVILGTAAFSAGVLVLALGYLWRSHRQPIAAGAEHMAGVEAEVLDWSGDEGFVWSEGERWRARGPGPFQKGDRVKVVRLEGLTLKVQAAPGEAGRDRSDQPMQA